MTDQDSLFDMGAPGLPGPEADGLGDPARVETRAQGAHLSALEVSRALGQEHPPTPEQTAVIEAPLRAQLVVAGAGSGKTETMTARVVWLVANGLVEPEQVLGLTFTLSLIHI